MSVEDQFPTTYLPSEKLVHNVQFRIINVTEYYYHANRLPIYDLDTLYYASNTKYVVTVWPKAIRIKVRKPSRRPPQH